MFFYNEHNAHDLLSYIKHIEMSEAFD